MSKPMARSGWLSTLSMSALFLFLALSLGSLGCRGHHEATADAGMISVPVRLTVTPSRPSGTLDSLPDLTWALSGEAGLSLVVRAQGPGNAAPGAGFAGVRIPSGPVRYLGADGAWGDTEVAYSNAAAASGTLRPTAPLPLEGEWRFDFLVRGASGDLKAVAVTKVVLSGTPSVRVSLSRRGALAGDTVTGTVVLTKGSTARPVKLIVWWQAPDGTAAQLPSSDQLAFDGLSADVSLPVLMTRLDDAAPTGTWALIARLFDGTTGAPLGYGEQSLQVCPGPITVSGTVVGSDGAPLGANATLAFVSVVSLDRADSFTASIGQVGEFSLALRPGAWMLSAMVVDAAGTHNAFGSPLQVTGAMAPLMISAAAPVVTASQPVPWQNPSTRGKDHLWPVIDTPAGCSNNRTINLRLLMAVDPPAAALISPGTLDTWGGALDGAMAERTNQYILLTTPQALKGVARMLAISQGVGGDATDYMRCLDAMMGSGVIVELFVVRHGTSTTAPQVDLTLSLVDIATMSMLRQVKRTAWLLGGTITDELRAMVKDLEPPPPTTLLEEVQAHLDYPLEPRLNLIAGFGSVLPSSQQTLKVHLADCDGSPSPGKLVELRRSPVPFPVQAPAVVSEMTDANGDATFTVLLGVADEEESLSAIYRRRATYTVLDRTFPYSYGSQTFTYAVQRGQSGQVQIGPVVPVIHPGGSLVLTVTTRDPVTGAPQPVKPIAIQSDLGGLQQGTSGTTDANGEVSTTVAAGNTVGLGKADAYLTIAPPIMARLTPQGGAAIPLAEPPNTGHASEYLVVSSPVALNFSGPTGQVLPGAVVPLTGSLLLDGLPLVGHAITLTCTGGGTLSAGNLSVNDTGGFEATFQPPPDGTGSATVTATTIVEGQTVTKDVPITWAGNLPTPIAFTRSAGGAVQIFTVDPEGTNLTQITFGTNHSQAPAWSPDHKKIAFMRLSEIFVMNADGTGAVQITSHALLTQGSSYPTWSPDGTRIAYHEAIGHPPPAGLTLDGLAIVNADGSNPSMVTSGGDAIDDSFPAWSPDGTAIAFNGYRKSNGNGRGIIVHVLATNAESFLTPFGATANYPAWSPSGSQVAYSSGNLFRVNADGSGTTPINIGTGNFFWPGWSPDGSKIVAQGTLNGVAGIYIMNLDGTNPILVPGTENGSKPSW